MSEITMYDIQIDQMRPVTQEDWDRLEGFLVQRGRENRPEAPLDAKPEEMDFQLAVFKNPHMPGYAWICEDKPVQVEENPWGKPYYHPTPNTPWHLPTNTNIEFAKEIVRRWNLCAARGL